MAVLQRIIKKKEKNQAFSLTVFIHKMTFTLRIAALSTLIFTTFSTALSAQDAHLIDSLNKSYQEALKQKNDTNALKTLYKLSKANWDNNHKEARRYGQLMLDLAKSSKQKKFEGMAYRCFGIVEEYDGNYVAAMEFYKKNLALATEVKSAKNTMAALSDISDVYMRTGQYVEAMRYQLQSLQLAEANKDQKSIAGSFNGIGIIYDLQKKPEKALRFYFASLKIKTDIDDKSGIANTSMNIGLIYENKKAYNKALEYHAKALALQKELFDDRSTGLSYINMGNIYTSQLRYPTALSAYDSALQYLNKAEYTYGLARVYACIGDVYLQTQEPKKAVQPLQKSLALSLQTQTFENLKLVYRLLHNLDSMQGDYASALKHYKLYVKAADSLVNEKNTEELVTLQLEYDFEKERELNQIQQHAEIKNRNTIAFALTGGLVLLAFILFLLYRRSKLLKLRQQETQQNLEEKEVLLREIHHRVKNNLAVISGLLYLQKNRVNDETIKGVLLEGQNRIDSMVLVHEMLYQSNNIAAIDLQSYLNKLINQIAAGFEDKNFQYTIQGSATLEPKQAVPLGLILTELITNIYKYAYPGSKNGSFTLEMSAVSERLSIVLSDKGKGLPEDFDMKKSNTLGLKLVKLLCQQMGAELSFTNDSGTRVSLQFAMTKETKVLL